MNSLIISHLVFIVKLFLSSFLKFFCFLFLHPISLLCSPYLDPSTLDFRVFRFVVRFFSSTSLILGVCLADSLYIISCSLLLVNSFFYLFCLFLSFFCFFLNYYRFLLKTRELLRINVLRNAFCLLRSICFLNQYWFWCRIVYIATIKLLYNRRSFHNAHKDPQ